MNLAEFFLEKGFLVNPDFSTYLDVDDIVFINDDNLQIDNFFVRGVKNSVVMEDPGNNLIKNITNNGVVEFGEMDNNKNISKNVFDNYGGYDKKIKIVKCYREKDNNNKRRDVNSFVSHFKNRFNFLKNVLLNRDELQDTISINKLKNKKNKESVSIIGFVRDKRINKTGSITLTLEDITGDVNILFNKNLEFFDSVKDTVLDEVIGVNGLLGDDIVFANKIFFPDVPISNELKKYDKEEYIVFTSDVHIGNKFFFEKNFSNFIKWLNLEYGNEEQKNIAKKVKYVFFVGDLCDGIGVYPDQEDDLIIKDIYEQYDLFGKYVNSIRKDITVILICGNHDAVRLSEPQPILDKKIAPCLFENENIVFMTNPSVVNICSNENFPGFNILLYHGFSFVYYSEEVDSIRRNGRLERVDLIMKYLLQKRHLAPAHGSNLYIPDNDDDNLLIDKVPDFFASGHIHKTKAVNFRGITLMNCGCWIGQTEDQEKRGIVPDPNRIIAVNLQTRDIKILNFEE